MLEEEREEGHCGGYPALSKGDKGEGVSPSRALHRRVSAKHELSEAFEAWGHQICRRPSAKGVAHRPAQEILTAVSRVRF